MGPPASNYRESAREVADVYFILFTESLENGLGYFQQRRLVGAEVPVHSLSEAEKIEVLLEVARQNPAWATFRDQLVEDLLACEFAEAERRRIVREYRLDGEHVWFYPLATLAIQLGDVADCLEASLACQTRDYRRFLRDQAEGK